MKHSFLLILSFLCFSSFFSNKVKAQTNDTVYVTINKLPVKVNPVTSRDSIYAGQSAVLSVSNCTGTVTWSNGLTGASITISPTTTKYYWSQCTSVAGCTGPRDSVKVSMKTLVAPTSTSASTGNAICLNESTALISSGCNGGTINWSNGQTGQTITVTPSVTTTYTYTCTYSNAGVSSNSPSLTITVKPRPVAPTLVASNNDIVIGSSTTITASNCTGTVTWSNGLTGASITVSPTVTSSYSAYCTTNDCYGASSTQQILVHSPIPSVTFSNSAICQGDPITITAGGCSGSYVWSTGATTTSITVTNTLGDVNVNVLCRTSAGDSQTKKIKLKLQ